MYSMQYTKSCLRFATLLVYMTTSTIPPVEPRVGPPRGALLLAGGGTQSPSVFQSFIALAGGPDALIIDIPTAGLDTSYGQHSRNARILRLAGARQVVVLHTFNRDSANSDSVRALFARAGGVWFGGGRQGRLVDAYSGTAVERGLREVLARGGVVGGTSAGASILASFLVRGSPVSGDGIVHEGYTAGFGLLRGVAVDQHAAVRNRLRDLPDTVLRLHPGLLGIALDEGAGLLIRGDTATVLGRSNVFVYGRNVDATAGMPYRLLRVGEAFDLGSRSVIASASGTREKDDDARPSLHRELSLGSGKRAVLLAAAQGRVVRASVIDTSREAQLLPGTTRLKFRLGDMSNVILSAALQIAECEGMLSAADRIGSPSVRFDSVLHDERTFNRHRLQMASLVSSRLQGSFAEFVHRVLLWPLGMTHSTVDSASSDVLATADDLFRYALALDNWNERSVAAQSGDATPCDSAAVEHSVGWQRDMADGRTIFVARSSQPGANHLFVRVPECLISLIVLTDDSRAAVRRLADAVVKELLAGCGRPVEGASLLSSLTS
jgi:cyanophycinase